MTAGQLLEILAQSGLVEERLLTKLRKEITTPGKNIKPAAVIKVLVDKGQLTAAQGEKFLSGAWNKSGEKPTAVNKPKATSDYDSGDLTNLGAADTPASPIKPPKAASQPTPEQVPQEFEDNGTRVYGVDEVLDAEPVEVEVEIERTRIMDPMMAADPFGAMPATASSARESLDDSGKDSLSDKGHIGFAGKRDLKDQWRTKWLFIGAGALSIFLIVGAVLVLAVFQAEPEELFKVAEESYGSGTYGDAMVKFRDFYERFPKHDNASYAKVREVQCMLQGPFESKNYNETYKIALEKIPTIENEPRVDLIKDDFAVWFPDIVLDFSKKALEQTTIPTMEEGLKKAEDSKRVLDFLTQAQKRMDLVAPKLETIENNLLTVKGLIEKEKSYDAALAQIAQLAEANKTDEAFAVYNRLTRTYGDLGARQPLREEMKKVTAREITLVAPTDVQIATSDTDVPSMVEQAQMLVSNSGSDLPTIQDELLPFLIEGNVYVLSGLNGSVLWSRFVGYETTILPIWTDSAVRTELLLVNEGNHEVMRVNAKTGELLWRAEVGEPFLSPTLHRDMLFITTRSGVIIRLDPITGEKLIAAKIPKRLSVPVEVAEQDPFVYVVADDSNIYVLSTEELKCVDAYYLGHAPGDVKIPPIYWSGHLMVAVSGSDYCDLHVLRVAEDRYSLERLQLVRLADAPVSSPPIKLGRNILFTSDRGDLSLMELVTTEAEAPLMKAAELKVENRGSGKAFVLAQGSNMWLASKGLMTFRVNKNAGQIERLNITSSSDVFLAPIQKIENVLIHARRRGGSRQISVAAVSVDSLEEFWRSEFGAPLAGAPALVSDRLMAVSSQGDTFEIKEADGAFVSLNPLNKASDIDQALNFNSQLTVDGNAVVAIGDSNSSDMVTFDATSNQTMLSRMVFNEEKVSLAAPPATLSQDFILPSLSGLILRVDRTGRSVGSPFAPPLAPGESVKWSRPATNSRDEILVADEKQNVFLLDASQRGSLTQIDTISIDSTIVSPFAANDDAGFAVAELNGKTSLRKFSFASPLTQMANVELPARLVAGPFLVNNNLVVHLDDGRIYGWSMDCEPLWNLPIPNERIGNVFEMPGTSSTFVLLERGAVLNLDQTGNITKTIELGQPVRHLPVFVDDKVYFTSANGAVLVVDRAQLQ